MTREDFVTRWRSRQSEWARIGALVDGARVCEDVLQDFEAVARAEDDAALTLSEAAAASGYSSDHLRRLHRLGKLPSLSQGTEPVLPLGRSTEEANGAQAFSIRSCNGCSA